MYSGDEFYDDDVTSGILAAHGLEPAVTEIGKRADRLIIDIESRERARHDHEEDERDDWSPRSAYFDDEYRVARP